MMVVRLVAVNQKPTAWRRRTASEIYPLIILFTLDTPSSVPATDNALRSLLHPRNCLAKYLIQKQRTAVDRRQLGWVSFPIRIPPLEEGKRKNVTKEAHWRRLLAAAVSSWLRDLFLSSVEGTSVSSWSKPELRTGSFLSAEDGILLPRLLPI